MFYIDRYLNSGLSYDLAGKHNSCRVKLRAVGPDYGLHGHPLICEILKYAGISDATSKSHGNRNPYNVVYATFKALMTHESLEDIAMKRGVKFLKKEQGDWEFIASLEVAAVALLCLALFKMISFLK